MEKTEFLRQARCTPLERQALERAAEIHGLKLSEALRLLVRTGAQALGLWPVIMSGNDTSQAANEREAAA